MRDIWAGLKNWVYHQICCFDRENDDDYQFQGYPIFRQIHLVKDLFLVDLGGTSLISTSYTKNYAAPVKKKTAVIINNSISFLAIDLKCLVPQNVQPQFFWPKSNLFGGCFNINIPIHSQYISYILITLNIHYVTLATLKFVSSDHI